MKAKTGFALMAAFMIIGLGSIADAFHSGGVGECTGCHSMHASPAQSFLLVGSDQGSTCLNCHQHAGDTGPSSFHISSAPADMPTGVAPLQRTPGGDFGWLKKDYTMTIGGVTTTERGETHGHNITAIDFSYIADTTNTTAPGGTFTSSNLSCISCHDPHGKYRRMSDGSITTSGAPIIDSGSYNTSPDPAAGQAVGVYRLLGGINFSNSRTSGVSFIVDPPAAVAPAVYNRREDATQTRVAFGRGMSEWCAICHPNMHTNSGRLVHPVSQSIGSTIANNYNSYIKTGDLTGTSASSYLSIVLYEENSVDYTALKALAATSGTFPLAGPLSNAQVMCLTCHRAHASGWPQMTRWNNNAAFITYNGLWPGTDTTPTVPEIAMGRISAETQAAHYDRPASTFATFQRSLCNKCHVQD